tara:strand:- start:773 stop:1960 length:1188 start_codon:yes stop_codon:yes gene_type:complete
MKKIFHIILMFQFILVWSQDIKKIDSLIINSIELSAFPGAQVYIKKGDFKFQKSYGYHTYDSIIKIEDDHLYDLASITKTLASTLAIMKLYDENKFKLDVLISDFIKKFKRSNKRTTNIHELLMHQSGWKPYINHQKFLLKKNGKLKSRFISTVDADNKQQIAENIFIKNNYFNKILKRISRSKLDEKGNYKYSGLFFCLVPEIVKTVSNQSFEQFLFDNFYLQIGVDLVFNPKKIFSLEKIVPTEIDTLFRNQLIHGFVHDETAAIMGGVSGNAGLFGSAKDVGKISEFLLKRGLNNNTQIIKESTVEYFTNPGKYNRGLGFDKPRLTSNNEFYPNGKLSKSSYGHTGFTGTFYWVDPEKELIIVLLTNRVNPSRSYENLYDLDVRKKLIDLII